MGFFKKDNERSGSRSGGGFRDKPPGRRSYGNDRRGGSGGRGRDFDKVEFDVVCDNCGKDTTVPFKPSGSKPVLCRDCFRNDDSPRQSKPRRSRDDGGSFGRSSSHRDGDVERKLKDIDKKLSLLIEEVALISEVLRDVEVVADYEDDEFEEDVELEEVEEINEGDDEEDNEEIDSDDDDNDDSEEIKVEKEDKPEPKKAKPRKKSKK